MYEMFNFLRRIWSRFPTHEQKHAENRVFSPVLHSDVMSNGHIENLRLERESAYKVAHFMRRYLIRAKDLEIRLACTFE